MTNLLTSIITYFSAAGSGPLSSAITGGIHLEEAPPTTATPYCVMNVISAPATSKYGGVVYTEPLIQFTVYGTGAATVLALVDNTSTGLIAKIDEHRFVTSGSTNITYNTTRTHDPIPVADLPQPNESAVPLYGWAVSYRFTAVS